MLMKNHKVEIVNKKCPYCNTNYKTSNDFSTIIKNGFKECCDECRRIEELKEILSDYSNNQHGKAWKNVIHKQNMVEDNEQPIEHVKIFSARTYHISFRVINRSKRIIEIIDLIDETRKMLYLEVAGQFEVLDSIYENKNVFWNEGGNLIRYVHNASFAFVVIKLKELLSGMNSKCSIKKLRNIFENEKNRLFGEQKIFEVYKYDNGDEFEEVFDVFPIVDYLNKIDELLNEYSNSINAINDFRDNYFAHIGELKDENSSKNLSYKNIKRIFNLIKLIYDGFLYGISPDKYASLIVDHNIWFSHLDLIVNDYKKNKIK
jgi:hypothetical protein